MAKTMTIGERELGKAILARLGQQRRIPPALKPYIRVFAERHHELERAAIRVDALRKTRDRALAEVGRADAALDKQVDVLANRLIGADLGSRKNPFATFRELPPARVKELAYAVEIERVRKLIAAIGAVKPPEAVRTALAACGAAATGSEKALATLGGPQLALSTSIAARDALLPGWTRALERLRLHAKAAWVDEPATYRAIFAAPGIASPRPRRRRARPAPSPGFPATPALTPTTSTAAAA